MTADVNAEHFFFKSQLQFFIIFTDIWIMHIKFGFFFVRYKIKQSHLPGHRLLSLLINLIHHLNINHHELTPGRMKSIHGAGFDEAFYRPLIYLFAGQPLDKIFQADKRTMFLPFIDNVINNGTPHTFNGR